MKLMQAIAAGVPTSGPRTVHFDVTNACNAACITCWDHSPLLNEKRSAAWKKTRIDPDAFATLVDELAAMGTVKSVIVSGMGDPLVHPDIYDMLARVKRHGWHLTLMTNLIAADIDRLARLDIDQFLIGVHGATPVAYSAFHPGWDEREFFTLCKHLRALRRAKVRHVQVINRDTAPEFVDMVRFGQQFNAERVNFKLASLAGGTESCRITEAQREELLAKLPEARALAEQLNVQTNLDLFERQLIANEDDDSATTPMAEIGCFQGFVYTRITASGDVLYCCNTQVKVGQLGDAPFAQLWRGEAWQALRDRFRRGDYMAGCERCGKFEQNVKLSKRVRDELGDEVWRAATGQDRRARLNVVT